ncbi:CHAT domain-containing protein [Crucibulum laeve]|uniref:CHAT domain-containing protein n=1 Tax=Crucibulum laeve TaxID=68775 RepID=A0A5C3LLT0_9AGAR|nr:CHAT domain-containing protein [Crucibulum laeve]
MCTDSNNVSNPGDVEDREGLETLERATSIIAAFKADASMSKLEKAIFLFRKALNQCPYSHPVRLQLLKNLSEAFSVRFIYTAEPDDLQDSLALRVELAKHLHGSEETMPTSNDEVNDALSQIIELARDILSEFKQAVTLSDLETAVLLFDNALALSPSPKLTRFNRISEISDLYECLSRGTITASKSLNSLPDISNLLHACQLCSEFKKSCNLDQLDTVIALFEKDVVRLPILSEISLATLSAAASALHIRFEHARHRKDLDTAILFSQCVLGALPPHHPLMRATINNFAGSLRCRYDQDTKPSDLDMCIMLNQRAFELQPPSDPAQYTTLNNLANGLHTRFTLTGESDDLEKAIRVYRQVLGLLPSSHSERSSSLQNLAEVLGVRFSNSRDIKDLEEAILLNKQTVELRPVPHPDRPMSLVNLAAFLEERLNLNSSAKAEDLDYIVSLYREALDLRPLHHPEHCIFLGTLANSLHTRYKSLRTRADLDEASRLYRQALDMQNPPHPSSCEEFASILASKFDEDGKIEDLEEAISLNRTGLKMQPSTHPRYSSILNNLGSNLKTRFMQQGCRKDLDDAILLHREAVNLCPPPHNRQCMSLNNLASVLKTRFEQDGQQRDLDEAITLLRQVLELRPPSHPHRSFTVNNLGLLLSIRFSHHHQLQRGDLDEAIMLHREALELEPPPHPERFSSLNNLASALSWRFNKDRRRADLNEAVLSYREVLELRPSPSDPNRPGFLSNLARVLSRQFDVDHQPSELNEAVRLYREALELQPPAHAERYASLTDLAGSLQTLFVLNRQLEDLRQAITLYREALKLLSTDHPQRSYSLASLATALIILHEDKLGSNNDELLHEAMNFFREATTAGSTSTFRRFFLAKSWATLANEHSHSSAINAFESAIELLPQLAALSSDMQSRQNALTSGSDGLAQRAAACAIRSGEFEKAVEFLEAGRAVFWAQALQLRTPMDDIKKINPDLERRLRDIASSLEDASLQDRQTEATNNQTKMRAEAESTRLRSLNDEWNAALDEARQIKGFENFLKPRKFSDLRVAALNGPIVMVVPDEYATHILILTENSIKYFSCSKLPLAVLTALRHIITASSLLSTVNVELRNYEFNASERAGHKVRPAENWITQDKLFKFVLAILWDQIVKPIVDVLELQKSDRLETLIRWCLTGPFTFLPMHAAGRYPLECASDYLVSSYIPTISALLLNPTHRNHPNSTSETLNMLVVIQSETLPATKDEMEMIGKHVPPSCLTKLGVTGTLAGVEDVASHLGIASVAHFACHGIQNPFNPLESALILDDGQLQISRIMKQPLPNASLAFLCACETAVGDQQLPDEMISLAAALLYSGFHNVVGTMWAIVDEDGPSVADAFYEYLFRDENAWLDTKKTARALHIAVKKLRDNNIPFLEWVPFIHLSK